VDLIDLKIGEEADKGKAPGATGANPEEAMDIPGMSSGCNPHPKNR
jgi:hypothetical protein